MKKWVFSLLIEQDIRIVRIEIESEGCLLESPLIQKKYPGGAIVYTLISDSQNSLTIQLVVWKLLNNLLLVPDALGAKSELHYDQIFNNKIGNIFPNFMISKYDFKGLLN